MNGTTTAETLALVKDALAGPDILSKTITTGTGLVAYDLQASAKNLYPAATPIRNVLPRVGGGTGTATNWRQVNAIIGSGWDAMGWVPEGQRSGRMSYSTSTRSASYSTVGEEDSVTFEAVSAAQGFEDVQAVATMRLLQKMMLKEENAFLGGNGTLQLGAPATPSLSAGGSGGTLPAATYSVIVVALTYEGYRNSSLAAGVATSKSIAGADGNTFTLNGGSSAPSANATQAVTSGQVLSASVTPIVGAIAYAWYVGAAGSEKLQAITTISSVTFSASLAATTQAASAITADCSANPGLAYDGLMTSAFKSSSGAYVNYLATGTAGTGTALTASGRGSVNEIDLMLERMWDLYQVSHRPLCEQPGAAQHHQQGAEQRFLTAAALHHRRAGPVRHRRQRRRRILLQPVRAGRRLQDPGQDPPVHAAGHDRRLGREPAGAVPVQQCSQRRRGEDAARLLPDGLAPQDPGL
jgi:hypothetical protein